MNRRNFMGGVAAGAATLAIAPKKLFAASDRIRYGIIGVPFQKTSSLGNAAMPRLGSSALPVIKHKIAMIPIYRLTEAPILSRASVIFCSNAVWLSGTHGE